MFDPTVLKLTDKDILDKFRVGVANLASLSLELGLASLPHSLSNAYNNVLSIAVGTEYSFPAAEKIKACIVNPAAEPEVAKKEEPKEEPPPKEEDDDWMGGGLFD